MHFQLFSGIPIFRPSVATERQVRREVEAHLRARYSPGLYKDRDQITEILNYLFDFYYERLGQLLPSIASLRLLDFFLHEYENTSTVENLYKREQLDAEAMEAWLRLGPGLRRGLKYLAERIAMLEPVADLTPNGDLPYRAIEEMLVFAEELVLLYISSDQTHSIAPTTTTLEVFPAGSDEYMRLDPNVPTLEELPHRARRDTLHRDKFVPPTGIIYDVPAQGTYLNDPFLGLIGATYEQVMEALEGLTAPPADAPQVTIAPRDVIIQNVSKLRHIPEPAVDRALQGFTVSKPAMELEDRQLFRPKQEYRAYRRGFFEVSHPGGPHLAYSSSMSSEALTMLRAGVGSKRLPPEWRNAAVDAALDHISNVAGRWFENVVLNNLSALGLYGVSGRNHLGHGADRLHIPAAVGELDYVGYSDREQLVVLAECKLVNEGSEPKYFRDSLDKFIYRTDCYRDQLLRKMVWVQQNTRAFCEALATEPKFPKEIVPTRFATVLVTLYPSIATHYISEFPCRSITELRLDYQETGHWPYAVGVSPC